MTLILSQWISNPNIPCLKRVKSTSFCGSWWRFSVLIMLLINHSQHISLWFMTGSWEPQVIFCHSPPGIVWLHSTPSSSAKSAGKRVESLFFHHLNLCFIWKVVAHKSILSYVGGKPKKPIQTIQIVGLPLVYSSHKCLHKLGWPSRKGSLQSHWLGWAGTYWRNMDCNRQDHNAYLLYTLSNVWSDIPMFDQASNVSQCQWLKGSKLSKSIHNSCGSNGQILHFHTISLLILTHQPSSPIARFPHREGDGRSARIHLLLRSLQGQKPVPCGKPSGRWGMVGLLFYGFSCVFL